MYYSLINPVDSTYHIQLSTVNNKIIMIIGNTDTMHMTLIQDFLKGDQNI